MPMVMWPLVNTKHNVTCLVIRAFCLSGQVGGMSMPELFCHCFTWVISWLVQFGVCHTSCLWLVTCHQHYWPSYGRIFRLEGFYKDNIKVQGPLGKLLSGKQQPNLQDPGRLVLLGGGPFLIQDPGQVKWWVDSTVYFGADKRAENVLYLYW